MSRSETFRRLAAVLAFLPLLWGLPPSFAQDLDFGDDEEFHFDDEGELDFGGEELDFGGEELDFSGEELDFGEWDEDDWSDSPATPATLRVGSEFVDPVETTGFIIPNDVINPALADQLSGLILEQLQDIEAAIPVSFAALQGEFAVMGAELAMECAFDPVCLGRVGSDIGLGLIVIGRASEARDPGEIVFTLDLVNIQSRSVMRYRSEQIPNTTQAMNNMIERQVPYLFGIRQERDDSAGVGRREQSTLQRVGAWSSLVLGVASLGVGIYYGSEVASIESEVRGGELREGGVYVITQAEARERLRDADDAALMANIFLGSAVALFAVSALMFLITPGADIDEEVGRVAFSPALTPTVTYGGGWGIIGNWEF